MHAFISNAMAAWLVILAVSGWCHSTSDGVSDSSKPNVVACCKHCDHQTGKENQPAAPRQPRTDCHGVCIYLPVQESQVDSTPVLLPFDFAAIIPSLEGSQVAAALSWERSCDPMQSEPPLRLHLLHQIMLI